MAKKAVFVKPLTGFNGDARLFKVSPPHGKYEYVVVSAIDMELYSMHLCETYIFGADQDGRVVDWCELYGSYQGRADHCLALRNAGYALE